MVYTITLNPALDCYIRTGDFSLEKINRYSQPVFLPGGKGINVSLLLSSLGEDTMAMGFLAGFTGRELAEQLDRAGCDSAFSFLQEGLTRVNMKILPESCGETSLNGQGPDIPMEDLAELERTLATRLRPGDFLVLSGSIPGSMPEDVYLRLANTIPHGVQLVLDTSGQALRAGLSSKPFLVKPNLEELGELFGEEISGEKEAVRYAKRLRRLGARNVAVSMGSEGALLVTESGQVLSRPALPGREISAVGAGDSFVAGFIYGWLKTGDMDRAMDWAVCAGAATAFREGMAEGPEVVKLHHQAFGGK